MNDLWIVIKHLAGTCRVQARYLWVRGVVGWLWSGGEGAEHSALMHSYWDWDQTAHIVCCLLWQNRYQKWCQEMHLSFFRHRASLPSLPVVLMSTNTEGDQRKAKQLSGSERSEKEHNLCKLFYITLSVFIPILHFM